MDDESLFRTVRERLFTAVLGDVMDAAGLARQFLPADIRALQPPGAAVLVGRAMPVLEVDCVGEEAGPGSRAEPFGLMFKALDQLRPGEIYVATGGRPTYAVWGGLMSTRARSLGAVGAVLDGMHRDTREIRALGFPVFSRGAYAQDQKLRGRVVDFRCAVRFENGCELRPGDLLVGDEDGVVVIPAAHAGDVVARALAKVEGEDSVRRAIEAGEETQSVFQRTGIM